MEFMLQILMSAEGFYSAQRCSCFSLSLRWFKTRLQKNAKKIGQKFTFLDKKCIFSQIKNYNKNRTACLEAHLERSSGEVLAWGDALEAVRQYVNTRIFFSETTHKQFWCHNKCTYDIINKSSVGHCRTPRPTSIFEAWTPCHRSFNKTVEI